ncbi:PrgI family protein [Spongiactinospora gelatinilytica]|uniref:PrgI family protein n=1 Tax=Spongiactinospora gelatinilytica TaxID=2666298 RepID=A0A2W2EL07_9ACTN|nr:PrgI family protein [Spongiactinospora gelatinilytica]PZG24992.1 PrgI family protein [Spongiactinospora gelatinilytica]
MSWTPPVRIPADIDQDDRIIGGCTARQVAILGGTGLLLYGAYVLAGERLPLITFAALALPIALAGILLALGRRDGLSLDRYVLAAIRYQRSPKHLTTAPLDDARPPAWARAKKGPRPGPLPLPAHGIAGDELIDLGTDGVAAVAEVSTVNFALRTPGEQDALVAVFGRWLNSLSGPAQLLLRAERVDLTETISGITEDARVLAHPALTAAAHEHAAFLADLSARHDLLRRQVLLIVREPSAEGGTDAAAARALRRLEEAARLLAACGLTVRPLNHTALNGVLASCFDPAAPPLSIDQLADPGQVITTGGHR